MVIIGSSQCRFEICWKSNSQQCPNIVWLIQIATTIDLDPKSNQSSNLFAKCIVAIIQPMFAHATGHWPNLRWRSTWNLECSPQPLLHRYYREGNPQICASHQGPQTERSESAIALVIVRKKCIQEKMCHMCPDARGSTMLFTHHVVALYKAHSKRLE